jgi:hypothetical protein
LKDVQMYHTMHHEIVTQKMRQITPPRNEGRYGERPCENPQCSECPKPRHMAVGYSSSSQKATVHRASSSRQTDGERLPNVSALTAADSSPPRQIAAATPAKIVTAPSNLFDNNSIFIYPSKWDPIKNGKLPAVPRDEDCNNMQEKRSRLVHGEMIIDASSHHLITKGNNDVDENMKSHINKDDGKQLYKVPQRQMKSDETYAREDLDLARSLRRGSSGCIRTRRGIKLGPASPDLSQRFHNFFLHLLFHCRMLVYTFCV